ncbi:MAG: carbohydrate ABC transporter permease [bacterium]
MGKTRRMEWFSRKSVRGALWKLIVYLLVSLGAIIFLIPFVWMLSTSLKEARDALTFPPEWIPNPIKLSNYPQVFRVLPFALYFKNSAIITLSVIVGQIVSGSLVAFAFARLRAWGRDLLFILVLSTLMIPWQVTLIPLFTFFRKLGWLNTFLPLIVPSFFGGSAFYIFLMRQYFLTIPLEMDDAARIDGCNTFQIYYKIILPLAKPVLATVAIFTFTGYWNAFLGPLIYLNDPEKWTVVLGLMNFQSQSGGAEVMANWPLLMAGSLVVVSPCIIIFFTAQKLFIQGVVLTGVKG